MLEQLSKVYLDNSLSGIVHSITVCFKANEQIIFGRHLRCNLELILKFLFQTPLSLSYHKDFMSLLR